MIISASRRTDLPAFYSEWFFQRLKEGYVLVRNPFSAHQVSRITPASGSVPPKTEIREYPAEAAKVLILDDITPAAMAAATVTPTAVQHRRQRNLRSIALMRHFFAVNWKKRIVLRIFFQMILSPFCQFRKDRQQCFTFFGQ